VLSSLKRLFPEHVKRRLKDHLGVPSVRTSLVALRRNGFSPKVVLDIGAYRGEWTQLCKEVWRDSAVLMIEAQPSRLPALEAVARIMSDVAVKQAVLGPKANPAVPFYEQDSASSVLPETSKRHQVSIPLEMRTLDDVTAHTTFAEPDFIKVDVQGYELDVLRGGGRTLTTAEVVILEVNLLEIYEGAPLLQDVVNFMADAGLRAYDVCTLYRRPKDLALWQLDMIFVRGGSQLIASKAYE
jgi:FkbM family methyltransferase